MNTPEIPEQLRQFEIPGRVTPSEGNGDLLRLELTSQWANAEVYLHGAHVTDFRKKGEPPVLFTSQCSRFAAGQPIRGGVPIIFPWFGAREGEAAHGFARIAEWELHEATTLPEGGVSVRFRLPATAERATWPPFQANYVVTLTDLLTLELIITNTSPDTTFSCEDCLHSYFTVGDIAEVTIAGLEGVSYQDKMDHFAQKTETSDAIRIGAEVDRIYLDTPATVHVNDLRLKRRISIEKSGAASTVLWNPWIVKSQQMPDFGTDEYQRMVCVESGNVARNRLSIPPGATHASKVTLRTEPL